MCYIPCLSLPSWCYFGGGVKSLEVLILIHSPTTYSLLGPYTVASSASCSDTPSAYVLLFIGEMSYCRIILTVVAVLGKQNGVQAQEYSVFCYQFAACNYKSPSTGAHLSFVLPVITRTYM